MTTVPKPSSKLLPAEDLHEGAASLTAALEQRQSERGTYHEFNITKGSKFACMALEGVSLADHLPKEIDLKDGLWALPTPPFEINKHWQEWIGSIQSGHFSNSNLLLFAMRPPDQVGPSESELKEKVWSLFYAILMLGVPHYDAGLLLTGENWSGTVNVQSVTTLYTYYRPAKVLPARIDMSTLKRAAVAAGGLQTIYKGQRDYRRLRRGVEAWITGIREGEGILRLHQFVRAIEALVKPSADRAQFIHRCQLFTGRSGPLCNILGELYDLRWSVEHMNDWESLLSQHAPLEQDTIGWRRAYQAEVLASRVYLRVLKEDNLRTIFISDDSIDQFWAKPNDEQSRCWGETIDLEAEATKRFLDSG